MVLRNSEINYRDNVMSENNKTVSMIRCLGYSQGHVVHTD